MSLKLKIFLVMTFVIAYCRYSDGNGSIGRGGDLCNKCSVGTDEECQTRSSHSMVGLSNIDFEMNVLVFSIVRSVHLCRLRKEQQTTHKFTTRCTAPSTTRDIKSIIFVRAIIVTGLTWALEQFSCLPLLRFCCCTRTIISFRCHLAFSEFMFLLCKIMLIKDNWSIVLGILNVW